MSAVCRALGVSRSILHVRANRGDGWRDARRDRTPISDQGLETEIRAQIADLPTYGYRRTSALLNRTRRQQGLPAVNAKRVYRVMAANSLLLPKALLPREIQPLT